MGWFFYFLQLLKYGKDIEIKISNEKKHLNHDECFIWMTFSIMRKLER